MGDAASLSSSNRAVSMRLPAKLHYAGVVAAVTFVVLRISFGTYLDVFLFAGLLCFAATALTIGAGRRRADPARDAAPAA